MSERLNQLYRKMRGDGVMVTKEALLAVVQPVFAVEKPKAKAEPSMVGRFGDFMDTMRGMGYAPNTLGHYGTVRNTLGRFLDSVGRPELLVSGWDMARHQQFVGYPREVQGLVNNAVFSTVKDMKASSGIWRASEAKSWRWT